MTAARYDHGVTIKITVSLPDELVEQSRAAVRSGRAASVSAYVAEALREKGRRRTLADWVAEQEAEFGPITEAEMAWAQKALRDGDLTRPEDRRL
jgi:Arc/MetJ-type ribon-helix-helix transcriptional regulator